MCLGKFGPTTTAYEVEIEADTIFLALLSLS